MVTTLVVKTLVTQRILDDCPDAVEQARTLSAHALQKAGVQLEAVEHAEPEFCDALHDEPINEKDRGPHFHLTTTGSRWS